MNVERFLKVWCGLLPKAGFAAVPKAGFAALLALGLSAGVAQGSVVQVSERSEPAGVWETRHGIASTGSVVTTQVAAELASGYRFAYWTLNGEQQRDALGVALNPVRFVIEENAELVAHYLLADVDTAGDGIPDALKLRYYGDLAFGAASDTDGDGFDFLTELARGYHPKVKDRLAEGGIARLRSGGIEVLTDLNMARLRQVSEPFGIVAEESLVTIGSTVALVTPPAASSGYRFIGWFRDGVRKDSSFTLPPVRVVVDAPEVTLVARYLHESVDADGDGIPDYLELFYYNDLETADATTDSDGDGFDFLTELARGYHPLVHDRIVEGGIAARRSWLWEYNSGFARYTWSSAPVGLLAEEGLVALGSRIRTPDLYRHKRDGHTFAYWSVAGVPQRLANGVALTQLSLAATGDFSAVAHYFPDNQDSSGDGIPDWQILQYYEDAFAAADLDTDGDGFDLRTELLRGYHPLYHDRIVEGGIAARRSQLFAVLLNLVTWGANDRNQTQLPPELAGLDLSAIRSGEFHNVVLSQDGILTAWGDNSEGQLDIPQQAMPALMVVSGYAHNLALREDGTVVGWGLNIFRQARPPANLRGVVNLAAGRDHSLALIASGEVFAWGRNNVGQTRVPELPARAIAVAGGGAHSLALLENGTVVAWGDNAYGQSLVPPGLSNVIMIAAGQYHSLALRGDGTLVAWGDNTLGQVDIPDRVRNIIPQGPQSDPMAFILAPLSAGSGEDDSTAAAPYQQPQQEDAYVVSITAGMDHSLALFADGSVVAWGRNDAGQATVPQDLGNVIQISAGQAHSVALRQSSPADSAGYTLTIDSPNGSVARTPFRLQYTDGESVQLTPQPHPGYVFTGWSGALSGSTVPAQLTFTGNTTIGAHFARDPQARFAITTAVESPDGTAAGSIQRSPDLVDYDWDTAVTLTAHAASGYRFVEWYGDASGDSAAIAVTMDGPKELVAVFAPASADPFVDWQERHFGSTGAAPATVIKGGRSVSLQEAFLVGEDPFDPQDFVRLITERAADGNLQIHFHSLQGRRYILEYSTDLQPDSWIPLEPHHDGINDAALFSLSGALSNGFYRLKITPAP